MPSDTLTLPADLETKSRDAPPPQQQRAPAPPRTATPRRYRPRRTTADRVREALLTLAQGHASLLTHEEKAWASITFSGTRHEVMLDFDGPEAVAAGEEFIDELPEHEFRIPGQLVADATVREIDHRFGADERLVVTAVLLLLEEG
ncbi:hypothetical protein [Erythrobacter sp. HL-111]|uniref:hypothetical protein n=1 Tax=Erythrobacter sp. HL-111 TaxID=1798193 RepID=UPI0006DB49E4|nr:hypothetical protein [Erythrobacter sp. HL-111]KPP85262.1 MAG: hypothetical protein HLUCCO15_13545 [Erythrobacteraceae bacterium HL-111]SDS22175.1 hypothetical protein SAMN04515621_1176 [Erythrobacter sp. HL-111]